MGQMFHTLISLESLYRAFLKARRGKRKKPAVAAFEYNLEYELIDLQNELREKTYRPGGYRSFYRTEAKRRLISAAPFRDRVVHHALVGAIQLAYERRFIFDSYANRTGKGTHKALDRCTYFLRRQRYSLQCDIRQFFPSIDHALLNQQLARRIQDQDVLWLCGQIIATGSGVLDEVYEMAWFSGDDLLAALRRRGLPIGNLTSQFWANVYLNPLDQFVKRQLKCRSYLRYVDDFILFAEHKETLHCWREELVRFLAGLRLTLHEESAQVRPAGEGLPLLGFVVFPDHRRILPRRGLAFRRRLLKLMRLYREGAIPLERLNASVLGWAAHASHGDTWGLRQRLFSSLVV